MAIKDQIPELLAHIKANRSFTCYNDKLFDISEGDLLTHLIKEILSQSESKATIISTQRAAPINIFKKIISKLSKLYTVAPKRITENPADLEIVQSYVSRGVNISMNDTNENFNRYKNSTIELYEDSRRRQLRHRSIPSNQFLPYSNDSIDPLEPTIFIKFMGNYRNVRGEVVQKFWAYSDIEFISFDSDGEIILEDMALNEGENSYGVMPFPYVSKSRYLLVPKIDTDVLQMTLLIPLLLTDLNFASKFLSNPIIFGIDVDQENFELSPNIFWNLKSDEEGKTPKLDVIKAEPDIAGQINLIKQELGMWLESKNIKPGTIGRLTAENFASGISLLISEMDTTQDIKGQEKYFRAFEIDFWRRLAIMHNKLAQTGRIDDRRMFSDPENLIVVTEYADIKAFEGRNDKVNRLSKEVQSGFNSRRNAMREYYPLKSEEEIDQIIEEIKTENTIEVENNKEVE